MLQVDGYAADHSLAEHSAVVASLIEPCKLNSADPHAYLTDVLERLVTAHSPCRIRGLAPWGYAAADE